MPSSSRRCASPRPTAPAAAAAASVSVSMSVAASLLFVLVASGGGAGVRPCCDAFVVPAARRPLPAAAACPIGGGGGCVAASGGGGGRGLCLRVVSDPVSASEATVDGGGGGGGGGGENKKERVTSKVRQLKDRMWVRETLEDLTAADFAASIDAAVAGGDGGPAASPINGGRVKRAVDFENIISKLEKRVEEMCVLSTEGEQETEVGEKGKRPLACYPLNLDPSSAPSADEPCYSLVAGRGMGSVVYTDEQREALLLRLLASRQTLLKVMKNEFKGGVADPIDAKELDQIRVQLQDNLVVQIEKEEEAASADEDGKKKDKPTDKTLLDMNLYIRDDGTIDWDGAIQDRAAIKKFGSSVWARINGVDPESIGDESERELKKEEEEKKVTVKIVETEAIRKEKARLDELRAELDKTQANHTALLNSAVKAGSAVANVNLASLDPKLRAEIRSSAEALEKKQEEVSFQMLNYELERIFTYLEGEMGNTATKGAIPLQDRLNVAEYGLLESQVQSLNLQLKEGKSIDADVLAVISEQLVDFKRRLGIDYYVTGFNYDKGTIMRYLSDLVAKSKVGLAFYVKGCQLFWDDILYSIRLIGLALQGYTLQPREVRNIRRTFKDLVNFIPFIIILIIPLSPVGHVLVFGAIQRVFPDFFPSCFTERRQNLLQLYESTEYTEVTINETWQEKSTRIFEAFIYMASQFGKKIQSSFGGETAVSEKKEKSDEMDQ